MEKVNAESAADIKELVRRIGESERRREQEKTQSEARVAEVEARVRNEAEVKNRVCASLPNLEFLI